MKELHIPREDFHKAKGEKYKMKKTIKDIKADLFSLSEEEINELFREIKESKKKQRIKTIPIEQLENLIGVISIGGDAVKESEKYYE